MSYERTGYIPGFMGMQKEKPLNPLFSDAFNGGSGIVGAAIIGIFVSGAALVFRWLLAR